MLYNGIKKKKVAQKKREIIMTIPRPLLAALDNDFSTAVRVGDKDKAIATLSALVGIAISVASAQAHPLYAILTKVTTLSLAQMTIEKNAVVSLIAKNI